MGCFTPATLPVLSGLARGYAVCDHWFSSVPTETMPNRAFACAGTSQGHMDDMTTHASPSPSIFGLLTKHSLGWAIYGYTQAPLTRLDFTDTASAAGSHFGVFTDFQAAAAAGTLPPYHVPGAELGLDRQQPASELRRGARRAAHPRRVLRAAQRARLEHRRC